MEVRYRGHSCVEVRGEHHLLIDPDFTEPPAPGVEFICITHAHRDHIAKVASVDTGTVLASPDVCEIAERLGVPRRRLRPVKPGEQVANIRVFPGNSATNGALYTALYVLFKQRLPDASGTPLAFMVEDELTLLHDGDAHEANEQLRPDILCLTWRTVPVRPALYRERILAVAAAYRPRYVLPIHYDLPKAEADPCELERELAVPVLLGRDWHTVDADQDSDQTTARNGH